MSFDEQPDPLSDAYEAIDKMKKKNAELKTLLEHDLKYIRQDLVMCGNAHGCEILTIDRLLQRVAVI